MSRFNAHTSCCSSTLPETAQTRSGTYYNCVNLTHTLDLPVVNVDHSEQTPATVVFTILASVDDISHADYKSTVFINTHQSK